MTAACICHIRRRCRHAVLLSHIPVNIARISRMIRPACPRLALTFEAAGLIGSAISSAPPGPQRSLDRPGSNSAAAGGRHSKQAKSNASGSVTAQLIKIRALDLSVAEVAEVDQKLSVDCCHGNDCWFNRGHRKAVADHQFRRRRLVAQWIERLLKKKINAGSPPEDGPPVVGKDDEQSTARIVQRGIF